ncbi:Uncharacterized protein Rs2_40781 [Raphanus sativus]|nr:Uncharacterized protein Rs2_40781 [Raphanus sativus]
MDAGSGFPFFRSPVLISRRRHVTQWVTSYTTDLSLGVVVSRTEEWCEVSTERVSFSGSRFRCVARLHVLGLVNRSDFSSTEAFRLSGYRSEAVVPMKLKLGTKFTSWCRCFCPCAELKLIGDKSLSVD